MTSYFNHAKHTLSQLDAFLHDAMNEENLSAEEIYDVIIENVASEVEHYQVQYQKSEKLFNLLKGTAKPYEAPWTKFIEENGDGFLSKEREGNLPNENDCMPPWGHSDIEYASKHSEECNYGDMIAKGYWMSADGFWMPPEKKEDKVVKWSLPVEEAEDGEYYITFPEDLLEASKLSPGDNIEWVKMTENSYLLRKVNEDEEV